MTPSRHASQKRNGSSSSTVTLRSIPIYVSTASALWYHSFRFHILNRCSPLSASSASTSLFLLGVTILLVFVRARRRHGDMEASKGFVGWLLVAEVLLGLLVDSTGAYVFYAGGRDGWVLHPSESYHDWAGRNRFQVNDTIVFRYKKGSDSVLVVTKQDYDACDVSKPIQKLDGGDSAFKIDRSGPLYFISGAPGKCRQGQKLVVVVMAVRQPPSEPSVPSPASPPHIPPSPTPAASPSPSASSPKPSTRPPIPPPSAHAPASPPSTAPAAGSPPPTSSEGGGFAPAPAPSGPAADSTTSSSSLNAFKMPTVPIVLVMLGASFLA
ncbi:unnamed protein product [Musa hybrid cultivar]